MINLLPAVHKKELEQQERVRLVAVLGVLLFLFFLALSLLLSAIWIYVTGQLQAQEIIQGSQKKETVQLRTAEAELKKMNFDIANVVLIRQEQTSPSKILQGVSSALPPGLYLTSLTLVDEKLSLVGFAPTRDALLAFRSALGEDTMFSNITLPQSVWAVPQDISFSLQAEVNMKL